MTRPELRSRRRPTAVVAALTASVLLLAACGGGDSAASDEAEGNPNDPRNSPLAQLFGSGTSSADQRAQQLEIEQQVAQCMRDEGFEYEPVDYQAQMGDMNAEWEMQLSDPEGFGEKYGYGVVRGYEMQGDMGATTFEDPNQDYLNSLTPEENEAYYETLYGGSFFGTSEDGEMEEYVPPPLEEQGCQGRAMLAVYGENSPMTNTDMQTRMNELFEDMESDPDVARAIDDWASCMREQDASYDWERPEDAINEFYNRLSELQFGPMTESEDGDGVVVAGTAMDGGMGGMPEVDEADLEELREDELRTWRHDWDCQQEVDLAGVRRDAEQRLVDELLAEFPELQGS
jgi:hypothetical protein